MFTVVDARLVFIDGVLLDVNRVLVGIVLCSSFVSSFLRKAHYSSQLDTGTVYC